MFLFVHLRGLILLREPNAKIKQAWQLVVVLLEPLLFGVVSLLSGPIVQMFRFLMEILKNMRACQRREHVFTFHLHLSVLFFLVSCITFSLFILTGHSPTEYSHTMSYDAMKI